MIIPFGKYKGDNLGDIPNYYLEWLLDQDIDQKLLSEIFDELEDRDIHNILIK